MERNQILGKELMSLVYAMHREVAKTIYKAGIKNFSDANGKIIAFIAENSERDVFQRDIEQEFGVRRSSVSKVLKTMEEKGIIRRERVANDARLKKIVLTDMAKENHDKIASWLTEFEKKILQGITEEELTNFYYIINKLRNNIS